MMREELARIDDIPDAGTRPLVQIRGRGAAENPANRFVQQELVPDGDWLDTLDDDEPGPRTVFMRDTTRSIIARNDSPDVGFETSVNPYRGCEHGCLYSRFRCWARFVYVSPHVQQLLRS